MSERRAGRDRKPVNLLVKLAHEGLDDFVQRYATNLSPGGMFIHTRDPQPPDTVVLFRVEIAGGVRVLQGEGVVRWVRTADQGDGPPGMGLAFTRLDPSSEALVRRMLTPPQGVRAASRAPPPPQAPPPQAPPPPPPPDDGLEDAHEVDLSQLVDDTPGPAPTSVDQQLAELARLPVRARRPPTPEFHSLDSLPGAPTQADGLPPPPAPSPPRLPTVAVAPEPRAPVRQGPVYLKPPAQLPEGGPVIGIDLGTTNSACAVLANGKPVILKSKDGYNTIPSVVALNKRGELVVGTRAKAQLLLNPAQSISGAKRLVGRDFDSETVTQVRERFHYDIVAGADGKAAVSLGPDVLSLEEVQGLVLRECKQMAQDHLGQEVHRAVVTCPAYYSEQQREAVRRAAAMAGLKVERVLNEPTAAALAYGLNRDLKRRVLVYDLGGGTFDATLLRLEQNVFEVLATGGDVFLGGIDFDAQIVDLLLEKYEQANRLRFEGDAVALSRVADAAERAKIALSERSSFDVHLPMLALGPSGQMLDLRCTVTRQEIETSCAALIDRTIDVVRDVLLDAKLKAAEVDDVILVGGMSRMPLVRERIKGVFKKPPQASVNADEAVALGAALYSGTVDKVSSVVLIDVVPMTVGLGLPGGAFKRVIERNTPLPASRSFSLATSRDDEQTIELQLFQGEDTQVAANEYLGTLRIDGLPKLPKGAVQLAVTLSLDSECVLKVEARELRTRKLFAATLATRYTSAELRGKLALTPQAPPAVDQRAAELKSRAGKFWGFLKRVVGR